MKLQKFAPIIALFAFGLIAFIYSEINDRAIIKAQEELNSKVEVIAANQADSDEMTFASMFTDVSENETASKIAIENSLIDDASEEAVVQEFSTTSTNFTQNFRIVYQYEVYMNVRLRMNSDSSQVQSPLQDHTVFYDRFTSSDRLNENDLKLRTLDNYHTITKGWNHVDVTSLMFDEKKRYIRVKTKAETVLSGKNTEKE